MPRLATRLPDFGDTYDGRKQRALVQTLEQQLGKISVSGTIGAHDATTNFTVGPTDDVVLVDTTAGDITVTLPEISLALVQDKYEVVLVKKVAGNSLNIVPTGTDTILGAASLVVTAQWASKRFRAAVGNWIVI